MSLLNQVLIVIGVVVVLVTLSIFIFQTIKNKSKKPLWLIPLFGISSGVVIANIDAITKLTFDKGSISLEVEQVKESEKNVYATAEEVKKMRDEIESTKQNLELTSKYFIETVYLNIGTSNIIPTPLKIREAEFNRLNELSVFAVPEPKERKLWIGQMNFLIKTTEEDLMKSSNGHRRKKPATSN